MKPIKGLDGPEQPRETSKAAQVIGAGAGKLVEWVVLGGLFMLICAAVATCVMFALGKMHAQVPTVPPFGFAFIFWAIWGSSVLALFGGQLAKSIMQEDE